TSLNPFMGSKYPMHGWQANLKRTGAQPVVLGLRPKMKYPPLCGGMFIFERDAPQFLSAHYNLLLII
ncbi:MAG: hypothetical protein J6D09_01065, partial [Clostridia bacterium]|nr:hypothetical protein [Clostridia bacterium]